MMILGYIRVSTEAQTENYSVKVQRERAEEFAKKMNLPLELYDETGSASTLERKEFQRLLGDIKNGKGKIVWVIEFSRLTRDIENAFELRRLFIKYGVQLYENDNPVRLDSPEDEFIFGFKSLQSHYELKKTTKRTTDGRFKAIDKGYGATSIIFGYDHLFHPNGKSYWKINEEEADTVREIFRLYSLGKGMREISRIMIKEGRPTKKGGTWVTDRVSSVLRHYEYAGLVKNTKKELIESKVFEPIIDKALWEKCCQIKESRMPIREKGHYTSEYELTSLISCAYCGAKYYFMYSYKERLGKIPRYHHKVVVQRHAECTTRPKYIRAEVLEYIFRALYKMTFEDYNEVEKYLNRLRHQIIKDRGDVQKTIERHEKRLAEINSNQQKLLNGMSKGLYELDDISDQLKRLKEEKEEVVELLETAKKEALVKSGKMEDILNKFSDDMIDQFVEGDKKKKREMYFAFVQSAIMKDNMLDITFITGKAWSINIKSIPNWLYDRIILEYIEDEGRDEGVRIVSDEDLPRWLTRAKEK